ncbi:MAG: HepT-like ribonuclease domain-containing protein [Candidatus Fermentibacteraceae bacterium]
MSRHDSGVHLRDMLDHSREAVQTLGEVDLERFRDMRVIQLALTRLVEIIGEAANRTDSHTRECHPEIPWSRIIGMRNRLIHGYDVVDCDLLWYTVNHDLPPLIDTLEAITEE